MIRQPERGAIKKEIKDSGVPPLNFSQVYQLTGIEAAMLLYIIELEERIEQLESAHAKFK